MAAHKFWCAVGIEAPVASTLELSEFQLFNGTTRVDAPATLTCNIAPTSGSIAALKDGSTAAGVYWDTDVNLIALTWEFPSPQEVDSIVLGSRTIASRFPTTVTLFGGDITSVSGGMPDYITHLGFGGWSYASATLISRQLATLPRIGLDIIHDIQNYEVGGGIGRIPFEVRSEILPATVPKTYTPVWARVRLKRDIDGKLIREVWSDKVTGLGSFENLDEHYTYSLEAVHPDTGIQSRIASRVKPENYVGPL